MSDMSDEESELYRSWLYENFMQVIYGAAGLFTTMEFMMALKLGAFNPLSLLLIIAMAYFAGESMKKRRTISERIAELRLERGADVDLEEPEEISAEVSKEAIELQKLVDHLWDNELDEAREVFDAIIEVRSVKLKEDNDKKDEEE